MTSPRRPGRPLRSLTSVGAWLLALLAAVGLLVLSAGTASAATPPDGQTRVRASTPETITAVGVSEHIAAGQGRGPPLSQPRFVVATGVAAETAGTELAGLRGAATEIGENGYSPVGRALQKKLGRPGEASGWQSWAPGKGDPAGYSSGGARFVDDLMNDPATVRTIEQGRAGTPARWQDLTVYRLPSGQGAAFTSDGTFVGLRS